MQITRSYSKSELAMKYAPDITPHAAVRRLMLWITSMPQLMSELEGTGYQSRQKILLPCQVAIIVKYLGDIQE